MEEYGIDLKTLDLIKQQAVDLAFSIGPKLILGLIIYLVGKYLINLVQKIMSKALMTNKNKPNVKMVTGNVNKISKGFRKALSNDKTKATSREVVKLVTVTPGKNPAILDTFKILPLFRAIISGRKR